LGGVGGYPGFPGGPGIAGYGGGVLTGPGGGIANFGSAHIATTAGIRSALAPLVGCFYGLSGIEQVVLNLRAGFAGQVPHTRQQVARRLGTTPRQIRRTERQALRRLNGLAQTRGCGAGTTAVTVVNGVIGPSELAVSPSLVAFGNPAYQGAEQTRFARLGNGPEFGSTGAPARFGKGATNGSTWAIQLLVIMLAVALVGFRKLFPQAAAKVRRRGHPLPHAASVEYLGRSRHGTPEPTSSIGPPTERPAPSSAGPPTERERERIAA
jgi:hypothetical protein